MINCFLILHSIPEKDELLSNVAFNSNLRPFYQVMRSPSDRDYSEKFSASITPGRALVDPKMSPLYLSPLN